MDREGECMVFTCDQSSAIIVPSSSKNGSFVCLHTLLDSPALGSQMKFPCTAARGSRTVSLQSGVCVGGQVGDVMQPVPQMS